MIASRPVWTVALEPGEDGGENGHVWLLASAVAGCWFALDRADGRRRWRRRTVAGPNSIFAIEAGVLVGTHTSRAGALHHQQGFSALDLADGRLLWRDEARLSPRRVLRAAADLAGMRSRERDAPLAVHDGKLFTRRKRVLDLRTGRPLPHEPPPLEEPPRSASDALSSELFFLGAAELPGTGVRVVRDFDPKHPLEHLEPRDCAHPERRELTFGAVDEAGHLLWENRPETGGRAISRNFFGSRLIGRSLVLVECDPSGGTATLRVLDALSGRTERLIPLGPTPGGLASLQDADDTGVLIGLGSAVGRKTAGLAYFAVEPAAAPVAGA